MSNQDNTLPYILALVSTFVVLGLGYGIFKIVNSSIAANKSNDADRQVDISVVTENLSNEVNPAVSFSEPGIVPMGIAVKINGSEQMEKVNQVLKRSFQQEFPGTTVNIDADGSETGMRLLLLGQIDLAAIPRPLSEEERAQGLTAVAVEDSDYLKKANSSSSGSLYYVYREPANIKVEAFLGYLLSAKGQEAIIGREK